MSEEKNKVLDEPTREEEALLNDMLDRKPSYVSVRGKKWRCDWLHTGTERKLTSILNDTNTDEDKIVCKCVAALKLNGLWKIKLFYPLLWRYFYYIKQYRENELLPYIAECKKKVIANEYLLSIMYLTGMKDTIMHKTREEVNHIQAELLSEQLGLSAKNSQNS